MIKDKRRYNRYTFNKDKQISITIILKHHNIRGKIQNISIGGLYAIFDDGCIGLNEIYIRKEIIIKFKLNNKKIKLYTVVKYISRNEEKIFIPLQFKSNELFTSEDILGETRHVITRR